jgi:7,8-dihydropterin-6-yl-methyl-4-(beta-D-ribofuranosyl)aminobenzene 5'-phosphate synthase
MARSGVRGRQSLSWLVVVPACLMLVCAEHILEASVLTWGEGDVHKAGEAVMAEPSTFPTRHAEILGSPEPTLTAPMFDHPTDSAHRDTRVVLTVVYDNNPHDPRLRTAWGFACLVETPHGVILFDTGGDGGILLENLATLGFDPRRIDAVVLSHIHSDHVGGLDALLKVNDDMIVYLPQSFPKEFIADLTERTRVVEVAGRQEILPGIYSTGEMGNDVVEQSLVVETAQGLVVLTGCAHPGVTQIVRRAGGQGKIHLVMGGFHLESATPAELQDVIDEFRALGVEKVAPCHCTGTDATASLAEAFGPGFIPAGVGTVISIEP